MIPDATTDIENRLSKPRASGDDPPWRDAWAALVM